MFWFVQDSRLLFPACDSAPWMRSSQLDYLSLDFNSASPSPVQKVSGRHELFKNHISYMHLTNIW